MDNVGNVEHGCIILHVDGESSSYGPLQALARGSALVKSHLKKPKENVDAKTKCDMVWT